jgi:hypothetical protein
VAILAPEVVPLLELPQLLSLVTFREPLDFPEALVQFVTPQEYPLPLDPLALLLDLSQQAADLALVKLLALPRLKLEQQDNLKTQEAQLPDCFL